MPAQGAQWSYDCPGPDGWEGTCKTGVSQSPIDIPISTLENIVSVSYPEMVRATVINNGHGSPQVGSCSRFLPGTIDQYEGGGKDDELAGKLVGTLAGRASQFAVSALDKFCFAPIPGTGQLPRGLWL